jgi:DNA-binding transcriptional LysR family regulator
MRREHPLAGQELTLEHYCAARHLLVSFSGRPFGFVDEALALIGRERRVVLTVNQFFAAGKVVTHSNLLTVLPRHFVNGTGFSDQLVLRELPFAVPPVHVDALWHEWLRSTVATVANSAFAVRQSQNEDSTAIRPAP